MKLTEPMRNQPHLRNLRRIFGRQFVGCVGRPSRPEAGIATRVIPSQSSRRTFCGKVRAPLPICRPAYLTPATAQAFPLSSTPRSGILPQVFPLGHACPPKAQQLFECLLRCYRAAQSSSIPSFPLKTARNQKWSASLRILEDGGCFFVWL